MLVNMYTYIKQVEAGDEAKREKQLSDFFELNAFQLGEEGLVVKTLDGHYEVRCVLWRRSVVAGCLLSALDVHDDDPVSVTLFRCD